MSIAVRCSECIKLELCVVVAGGDSGLSEEVPRGSKCLNTREVGVFSLHGLLD